MQPRYAYSICKYTYRPISARTDITLPLFIVWSGKMDRSSVGRLIGWPGLLVGGLIRLRAFISMKEWRINDLLTF